LYFGPGVYGHKTYRDKKVVGVFVRFRAPIANSADDSHWALSKSLNASSINKTVNVIQAFLALYSHWSIEGVQIGSDCLGETKQYYQGIVFRQRVETYGHIKSCFKE
jgi:hypothetical protein